SERGQALNWVGAHSGKHFFEDGIRTKSLTFIRCFLVPMETKKALQIIDLQGFALVEAVWTGLEPATPCVTGRYSNQLNYQTNDFILWDSDNSQIQILFICFFKASANIHCQFRFNKT